jgi:hypothetical protein
MAMLPPPTCWRCASPVYNHWLRGYVCPLCTQVKAARRISDQQAKQFQWQREQANSQRAFQEEPTSYREPVMASRFTSNSTVTMPEEPASYCEPVIASPETSNSTGLIEGTIATLAGIIIFFILIAAVCGIAVAFWQHILHPIITFLTFGFL